jgi:hypothetical protein
MFRISSVVVGIALASAGTVCAAGASHSVKLSLDEPATVAGKTLRPGDYKLSWMGDAPKVDVTVEDGNKKIVEAQATIKKASTRADEQSLLLRHTKTGQAVLEEVRPRGDEVIVFSHS